MAFVKYDNKYELAGENLLARLIYELKILRMDLFLFSEFNSLSVLPMNYRKLQNYSN